MPDLSEEMAHAAAKALGTLRLKVEETLRTLEAAGKEAAELGKFYADRFAGYFREMNAGRLSPAIAEKCMARELDAMGEIAIGLKEVAAQEGAQRARDILKIAGEVGVALAKAAIAAAL